MRWRVCITWMALAPFPAFAEPVPSGDLSGLRPAVIDGAVTEPTYVWRIQQAEAGVCGGGVLFERAGGLLYHVQAVEQEDGSLELERTPVFDNLYGGNLGGRCGLAPWASVAVTAPFWLHSAAGPERHAQGLGLGDLEVRAPLRLWQGPGLALGVVPGLRLPTGSTAKGLGHPGLGASTRLAASGTAGQLAWAANLGFDARRAHLLGGVSRTGGLTLAHGWSLGFVPSSRFGVHAEIAGRAGAVPDEGTIRELADWPDDRDLPPDALLPGSLTELALTARGQIVDGIGWSAGIGRGLSRSAGSPGLRLIAGVAYRMDRATPEHVPWDLALDDDPLELDIADAVDPSAPVPVSLDVRNPEGQPLAVRWWVGPPEGEPTVGETVGRVEDELEPGSWRLWFEADGYARQSRGFVATSGRRTPLEAEAILEEPQGDARLEVKVQDTEGRPVEGARLTLDGVPLGTTGNAGVLDLTGLQSGERSIEASAEGFRAFASEHVTLEERDEDAVVLVLRRESGSVRVVVQDAEGDPVEDAVARFDGPARLAPASLGERGERVFQLRPGTWTMVVGSPTLGLQERQLVIREDDDALMVVRVTLQPGEDGEVDLMVRVVDPDGRPIDNAQITLDGRVLGTTSTGGTLRALELEPGVRRLQVEASRFRDAEPLDVPLVEGAEEVLATLLWEPGTVRVRAEGPDGPVEDAQVRFSGPDNLSPEPLGPNGEGFFQVPAGEWMVVVGSPTYGLQEHELRVPEDHGSLLQVDALLRPPEGGDADLRVDVRDPEGAPVPRARVALDGHPLGATSMAGELRIGGLESGPRAMRIDADDFQSVTQDLRLQSGAQRHEIELPWLPGTVRVRVTHGEDPVHDAVVRYAGPESRPPAPVNAEGVHQTTLGPGSWEVLVASPRFGFAQRPLEVTDASTLHEARVELSPPGEGAELAVRVLDPRGRPVPEAEVWLGEERRVTAAGGMVMFSETPPGDHALRVEAAGFQSSDLFLAVPEGSHERSVELEWTPIPVAVDIRDQEGNPVQAEVAFDGPSALPPIETDPDGQGQITLHPGNWRVLASAPDLATQREELEVRLGDEGKEVSLQLAGARAAMTPEQVEIREQVRFAFGSAQLEPEAGPILDEVANILLAHPYVVRVEVQGHTDPIGGVAVNQALSEERAGAVLDALVERGVPPERLQSRGYGPTRPIATNETDEGRAQNRRVEFDIREISAD